MKKGKAFCFLFSPICARAISSCVKRLRGIPVYRGEKSGKSITTIKQTVKALEDGDSIIIFIDTDYSSTCERSEGEIYKGFYAVDKLYYKRNGKRIPFVPVYSNEKGSLIHESVYYEDTKNDEFYQKIIYGIYNP
jgi:hypothetical protein